MSAPLVDDRSLAVRIWGAIDTCEQMRAAGRLRRRKERDGTIVYVHLETGSIRQFCPAELALFSSSPFKGSVQ